MLRKTGLIVSLSLLAAPSFAGLYVGAAIGPEGASFSQKAHVWRAGTFDTIDKNHFSGLGGFGSLFAGYGVMHDKCYLALEINGNLSSVEYKSNNDEYLHGTSARTTFTLKSSGGVSALPGYFVTEDTLFYARIGWINGRLKINEADNTIQNFNTNRNGIRYGLGIRHNLTAQWVAMMDYSQINYDSVQSNVFEPNGEVTKITKITPSTGQVAFGILYHFDAPQKAYVK